MPDLTVRLTADDVVPGAAVDIVPSHGSVASMATHTAVGTIESQADWATPDGCTPRSLKATPLRCLVSVSEVLAPSLIVQGIKRNGKPISLGELGPPPFSIMLPLGMLKPHVDADVRTTEPAAAEPAAAEPAATASPVRGDRDDGNPQEDSPIAVRQCANPEALMLLGRGCRRFAAQGFGHRTHR